MVDNWLFISLLTKIPSKIQSTIIIRKFLGLHAGKAFLVPFFSKSFGNYRISLSLMLLILIVNLAQCCLIFQKKSSLLFKFFWKKTSQKIVAYKPLLIKQNECNMIWPHFPKKMVPECKPDWNRKALTVFSRLSRDDSNLLKYRYTAYWVAILLSKKHEDHIKKSYLLQTKRNLTLSYSALIISLVLNLLWRQNWLR